MSRFQRSWELFKCSLAVMRRDPQLLIFPIVTSAFTILVALLFLFPVAFQPTGHSYASAAHWQTVAHRVGIVSGDRNSAEAEERPYVPGRPTVFAPGKPMLAYFAVMYFTSMLCATFFNVAFYKQIMNGLRGEPVSIMGGLAFACTRWKSILLWTLFAGLIGYVIKALEEKFGLIGRLVMRFVGTAWSVACVFVIPVIITEAGLANPFSVLKKSAMTVKQTWGESLIGYAGLSFGGLFVLLFSAVWLGTGITLCLVFHLYWFIAFVALGWVFTLCAWSYVMGVASQIFRCALFLYASEGALPDPYTGDMMAMAWKMKKA